MNPILIPDSGPLLMARQTDSHFVIPKNMGEFSIQSYLIELAMALPATMPIKKTDRPNVNWVCRFNFRPDYTHVLKTALSAVGRRLPGQWRWPVPVLMLRRVVRPCRPIPCRRSVPESM